MREPSARRHFVTPRVLSNLAKEHGAETPDLSFEVNAPTSLKKAASSNGADTIQGAVDVLRALASMYANVGLMGANEAESNAVDAYLVQSDALATAPFQAAMQCADDLDQHLALRTYLVGFSVTAADAAIWGAIRSSSPLLGIIKKHAHAHLARWYAHVDALLALSDNHIGR